MQPALLRVARFPPPAAGAAVLAGTDRARARFAADARVSARMQRVDRHVERLQVRPDVRLGPVGERAVFRNITRRIALFLVQLRTRDGLLAPLPGHPRIDAGECAIQRLDLADLAAARAQLD